MMLPGPSLSFGVWTATALLAAAEIDFESEVRPVLEARCFQCHGEEKQKGKLRLDTLAVDLVRDRAAAERWHDVRDAVNLGEMPPEEEMDLAPEERQLLVGWINQQLEALRRASASTGGEVVLRRLNRVEYENTMQDLLGIDLAFARDLPPDSLSDDGFRNNGKSLQMSDLQLETYLAAARSGLAKVIVSGPEPEVFRHTATRSVKDKGRGGEVLDEDQQFVAKVMDYPSEGEVRLRVRARARLVPGRGYPRLRAAIGYRADVRAPRAFLDPVDVTSEEWQDFELRGRIETFPLPSKTQSKFPGLLIWLDNAYAEGRDKPLKPRAKNRKNPAADGGGPSFPVIDIESFEFVGPVFDSWPPESHRRILIPSKQEGDYEGYAAEVLGAFVKRAFRRPVERGELEPYLGLYREVRGQSGSFETAIREALAMVLISPDFLYLVERGGNDRRALDPWELASRLSYFLWSTMPDERLFGLAESGQLAQPAVLRAEAQRMLDDPRAWQFVEQFVDQWLDVGAVDRVAINPEFYPGFDDALKESMKGETFHVFAEVLHGNLSALDLLDSDWTMLNEPLARHYGLEGPLGSRFERVAFAPDVHRGGLMSHGSVLLGNSTGEDSHPVKRAVWIRDRLLDDPPSDPPPNVPSLDSTNPEFARLPVREQLKLHREEASCNDCHRGIDPWGIALERYGADGLWRDAILRRKVKGKGMERQPVVSSATLPDGTAVEGLEDLKSYLLAERRHQFATAIVSKLLSYALGRSLELTDEPVVEELTASFIEGDYRIAPLIQLVVASELFQSK